MNTGSLKDSPLGRLEAIDGGLFAFVPVPLVREIDLDRKLIYLLDEASRAVATLAGVGETLPDPNLLIEPFLKREAVLSSNIEGTQTLLADLLLFEATNARQDPKGDAREVNNYVRAVHYGLARLKDLPLSVRLSNEIHAILLEGVRGEDKRPGELRTLQVVIGSEGIPAAQARFIPPPPTHLRDLLDDWEDFINADLEMPPLIQCALMHYQFESIHPYVDGNGRIGRLLMILFLCAKKVLPTPLLYLSGYFERYRNQYMDELLQVSVTGKWEGWLEFFLRGVADQAGDALLRSRKIRQLQLEYRARLEQRADSANAFRFLDQLFSLPIATSSSAAEFLDITRPGARGLLDRLVDAGILSVVAAGRPRFYIAREIVRVIQDPL